MKITEWAIDENGNKASAERWGSLEVAKRSLKTLSGCHNCTNCHHCIDCKDCENCAFCADCVGCAGLKRLFSKTGEVK
jgi:hypothetical protein